MRAALLLVPVLALALARPAVAQRSADEAAVLATVQDLFRGMKTKDTALMRSIFEPGARLTGMRTRADGSQVLQVISADQFIQFVAKDQRADWTERAFDPEVRIEGTLAQVWAAYDFHFGTTFSHCGVDAVQLLKRNGRWVIVAIADTFQREGCPDRGSP
ncbi:MAG: nuclear transport factor 2 family protein [Gemmatimonadales bacterium]